MNRLETYINIYRDGWETSVNSHSPIIPTVLIILVLNSCIVYRYVSEFFKSYGNKYKHFSLAGVWKWDLT